MNAHSPPATHLRQHSTLVRALTLALGLTISPFALSASGDYAPSATHIVTSCGNGGPGTLRKAIDLASTGDIIDLSTLSCDTITLEYILQIPQDDLTLLGKVATASPVSYTPTITINGNPGNVNGILHHNGTGRLKLSQVTVREGISEAGVGGCVTSIGGGVELDFAALKNCTSERALGSTGGAIHAGKTVKLTNSTITGSTAIASNGRARGGAIYAKGDVAINDGSTISNNTAHGENAYGGGIYSGGKLTIGSNRSTISGNKVITTTGKAYGGGAFVKGTTNLALGGAGIEVSGNQATGPNSRGGGLFLSQAGNMKYSSFTNNTAGSGGAIFSEGGTLKLDGCTIAGNTASAPGYGGGISASALDLNKSAVSGNHAAFTGGGLRVNGNAKIISSTISDNTAVRVAGASLVGSGAVPISIQQSTISGNESIDSKFGAGLYLAANTEIKNSTITGNIERNVDDEKHGAGISLRNGISVDLSSTIVSGNKFEWTTAVGIPASSDIGFAGSATTATLTGSHNLITFSSVTPTPPGTLTAAPKLGPLQDNGGPTWTHKPLFDSPAINVGIANGFTTDQRGTGFPRVVGPAPDIGAVEYSVFEIDIFSDGFEN